MQVCFAQLFCGAHTHATQSELPGIYLATTNQIEESGAQCLLEFKIGLCSVCIVELPPRPELRQYIFS